MKIQFGDNNNFEGIQIGDGNTLVIKKESKELLFSESDWLELSQFLKNRLEKETLEKENYLLAKEAMKYAEKKDEKGLKSFITRNKDAFFSGVLSNMASTGLTLLLKNLCM